MSELLQPILSENEEQCKAAVAAFKREIQKLRTGRASSSLVEGVQVDYYGAKTSIAHLGQISTPEPRLIVIQLYDAGAAPAAEKAIRSAGLNLNPTREGNLIRILIPQLTEETRKEIVRHLHKLGEDIKVSIRSHRRDANDKLKALEKDGDLNKDDAKKSQDRIQKQTDQYIAEVDKLLVTKEAECLEV